MPTASVRPLPLLLLRLPLVPLTLVLSTACGDATPPPADATAVTASHGTPAGNAAAASPSAMLSPSGSAGSQKAERRTNPAWTPCHAGYKVNTTADVATSVDEMAKGCAATTGMHVIDSFKGTQAASNAPQSNPLHAQAGHCYRAYAVAAATIQDLDLLIKDSAGAPAGEDSTDDPTPVVLEDGAVCFKAADEATVVVSIGAGSGAYAVQVWSD
jgi:hypothetical protein